MSAPASLGALLIVEDDAAALRQLRWTFEDYAVEVAGSRAEALDRMRAGRFPVVLLDLGLPPDAEGASEGLAALRELLAMAPTAKIIVVTGREERAHALKAVELGAYDFYRKPVDADELRLLVGRAFELQRLEEENRRLVATGSSLLPGIVATSDAMQQVCRLVRRAASSDISALIVGESGTGKELLARALHSLSERAPGPFVAINCAAIPENLLESELFGHERGAFTGAVRQSKGRLETADGGTLLLDEIGDMPLPLQAKLLRFLQERVIQRVGGREDIRVEVRVVSSTHRDLRAMVPSGAFREDLYYRISELEIHVPPLRERPEDAVALAHHFFERFREQSGSAVRGLAGDAVAAVARYAWPGNVRELENRIRRAMLMAETGRITPADLDLTDTAQAESPPLTLQEAVQDAERRAVIRAWAEADGNVSLASKLLGVSRPTVYKLLREHGLKES
jgi:two-component system NtrC family response regulator